MPYIHLSTNKQLSKDKKQQVLQDMTALVSRDLGKPGKFIMAGLKDDQDMIFDGSLDPVVFVELRSIRLPEDQTEKFSQSLSAFVKNHLEVNSDRLFINFRNVEPHMWGYNGTTF